MTRKSQSDAWERWIVSCCGLNKRLERSYTVGLLGILSELTGVPVPRRRVPTRSLAPTPAPRVAGRCGRLAPPDRAGRRIGGRDLADHAPDRTRSG